MKKVNSFLKHKKSAGSQLCHTISQWCCPAFLWCLKSLFPFSSNLSHPLCCSLSLCSFKLFMSCFGFLFLSSVLPVKGKKVAFCKNRVILSFLLEELRPFYTASPVESTSDLFGLDFLLLGKHQSKKTQILCPVRLRIWKFHCWSFAC